MHVIKILLFRYDNHFIIKAIARRYGTAKISLLASTKEKYTRIKTPNFCIHDSYSHLSDKLETLASNLKDHGIENFRLVRKEFPDDIKFNACIQKLIYPYSYMDSFERFSEPIPEADKFYNDLSEEPIDEAEYARMRETCKIFDIKNLGQLHDLYLKIDVLILASVFEYYRKMALQEYGLDPAYYVSSPSFSFDAMLFKTDVELELIKDEEIYNFIESGMRGEYYKFDMNELFYQNIFISDYLLILNIYYRHP